MAAQLAAALGARISGFDAAEAQLDIAKERVPTGAFRMADLESVPFATGSFDVVAGFNSFQFAGDPVRALGETRRVARPGGKVVVMTWGKPEGMAAAAIVSSLRALLPPPPPGAPGPFALSDEAGLRAFAEGAGLTAEAVVDVDSPRFYPDESTALRGIGSSGVAARAIALSGRDAVDAAHRAALAPFRRGRRADPDRGNLSFSGGAGLIARLADRKTGYLPIIAARALRAVACAASAAPRLSRVEPSTARLSSGNRAGVGPAGPGGQST